MAPKSKASNAPAKSAPPPRPEHPPAPAAVTKQVTAPPMAAPTPVTETKNTALAVSTGNAIAAMSNAPDWLKKHMTGAPRGLERVDKADVILPRLMLAQGLSPEVAKPENKRLGISVGDIFDNLTKSVFFRYEDGGKGQPLRFIPVVLGKSRFYLGDLQKDEGILCRSDDAEKARPGGIGRDEGQQPTTDCSKCVYQHWDESEDGDQTAPQCSLFYNIVVLLPDFGMMAIVLSMKHTQVKVAKRLLSVASALNADMFSSMYELVSVSQTNDKFTFMNYDFKRVDWVNEEQYNFGRRYYEQMKDKKWAPDSIDTTNADGSEASAPSESREPGSDDDEGPVVEGNAAPAGVPPSPPSGSAEDESGF